MLHSNSGIKEWIYYRDIEPTFKPEKYANHPVVSYFHRDVLICYPAEFGR